MSSPGQIEDSESRFVFSFRALSGQPRLPVGRSSVLCHVSNNCCSAMQIGITTGMPKSSYILSGLQEIVNKKRHLGAFRRGASLFSGVRHAD